MGKGKRMWEKRKKTGKQEGYEGEKKG